MYKKNRLKATKLRINQSSEGETLEMKIDRFVNNKETITDKGTQLLYQDRKEGVQAAYDIRTDRFEIAVEAMDKVAKSYTARREERGKVIDLNEKPNDSAQAFE